MFVVVADYLICIFSFILRKDVERMEFLAKKWGPVPRTLLLILEEPQHEVYFECEAAGTINRAIQNPGSFFAAIADHNASMPYSDSSSVFFIKPESKTDRYLYSTYVPTCWLMSQLVDNLVRGGEDVRAKFFDAISDYFRTGFISGSMFKEIIRCFLARGEIFTIRWYDHEIGTGGPVLTVPLDFKLLVSYQFDRRGLLYMCFVCRNQFLRLMLGLAWTSVRITAVMDI